VTDAAADIGAGAIIIARYGPQHLEALTTFYRDIWDGTATTESVAASRAREAARNVVAPGEEIPTWLVLQGERILGHLSTIPVQVQTSAGLRNGHWLIGFMVRPECRNGPVGFMLLKEAAKTTELLLSLTVAEASQRLFKAVGFAHIGTVPNWIRLLRPGRVLRRIDLDAVGGGGLPQIVRRGMQLAQLPGIADVGGMVLGAGISAVTLLRGGHASMRGIAEGLPTSAELDGLWGACAPSLGLVAVRDAAYLLPRYPHGADDAYVAVQLHTGGAVRGIAVVRRPRVDGDPRLRGIRVATLSDLVYDARRPDDGLALLAGAEQAARRIGADALLASPSAAACAALLPSRGYVRFGGNLQFLVRDATRVLPGVSVLADWTVSRGDMNADAVF